MASKANPSTESGKGAVFLIEGQIQREQSECEPGELKLAAYAFDQAGNLLGKADLDDNQQYRIAFRRLAQPADVELRVGPVDDAEQIRHSSAYSKKFSAKEWQGEGSQFRIRYDVVLPVDIWHPWWPQRICISGHVRKWVHHDGMTDVCPVPYVKVEVFDVDREACWWPWLRDRWEDLLDRPVIRIPDLLKTPPFPPRPFPEPDPAPYLNSDVIAGPRSGTSPLERVGLNPQPLPPRSESGVSRNPLARRALNPQPLPPLAARSGFLRVGEARQLSEALATRLDRLTLTSRIAPWVIFPHCFFSRVEVCETTTDCNGYFNCCFNWWPFHFRRGRLRFDARPDIIVRVTQIINGVSTVIYMDPYTSTRWDVSNAHIDLFLDNEDVRCGNGDCGTRPPGSPVFFTRIGDDEVYKINQATGLYNEAPLSNVAYGGSLLVYGQFGDALSSGAPMRYYRLSYAKSGSTDFKFVDADLHDTRVSKITLFSEDHKLGPYTVNGTPSLYEVRNFSDYYWYNPDWLGTWLSTLAEEDTGQYVLRLEVFDANGSKLTSAMGVDYRDGTVAPPAVLPPMTDRCDLAITLDNKKPEVHLAIPAVLNDCGVIPWSPVLSLDFNVDVKQENNRLRSWGLYYTKGIDPTPNSLGGGVSNNGLPGSVNLTITGGSAAPAPGTGMLANLTSTCAFALRLWAYAHVRDGRNFVYYDEAIQAIAVEKCPACPPCP
jgi:hypothetical protein